MDDKEEAMAEKFDPYHQWLGIPPEEQPPNHYRLLGVEPFEEDLDVIESGADEREGHLLAFQFSAHAEASKRLIEEIDAAKACLLNPKKKAGYDKGLRQILQSEAVQAASAERVLSERFLDLLQTKDLLPGSLIESLREQVAQSKKPICPAAVAKRLIEAGHLTPALAKRLLSAEMEEASPPEPAPPAAELQVETPPPVPEEDVATAAPIEAVDDDLELAPLDDEPTARPAARKRTAQPRQTADKTPAEPPPPPPPPPPQKGVGAQPPAPPVAAGSRSLLDEELSSRRAAAGPSDTGPLDGLMAGANIDDAAGGVLRAPRKKGLRGLFFPRRGIGEKTDRWDSSLMLVGGGSLLLLVILGLALIWALTRQSGDDALQQADEAYRAGSYTQAIHKYNLYLKKFPKHAEVSMARVNRGLALLRQATPSGTRDWPAALKTAQEVLVEISPEPKFGEAHGDLAVMLLAITEGLTAAARENPDSALVEQAQQSLALMEKYVPKSLQRGDKIAEIKASLGLALREIDRDKELAETTAAMKTSVAQGNTAKAYGLRRALLKQYPDLADNEQLAQTMLEVSRAQEKAVEVVAKEQPPVDATAAETLADNLPTLALAQSTVKTDVPDVQNHIVFAAAAGAAYGLDATTGKVLWRRFLGFGDNGHGIGFPPTPISSAPGSDALLVDPIRNELLRVEASSGSIGWRHPVGEPFRVAVGDGSHGAHPVIAGNKILLATESGRLVTVDAASGSSPSYIQVPQSLHIAPAVDSARSLIFQVADHSNLFVLGLPDGQCKRVVHLGHELGSISAPPVVINRFLILAINDRIKDSQLRILTIEETEDGLSLTPLQRFRLDGHIDTPPVVSSRRVLTVTDTGSISVFEITALEDEKPFRLAAGPTPPSGQRLVRFTMMQDSQLWIGDLELTRFDVQAARGELTPRWITAENSVFLQPLRAISEAIFHVRRAVGMPGVVVSAMEKETSNPYWETHLAAPLATEPMVAGATVDAMGKGIVAVTSIAGLFDVDVAALNGQTVLDRPDVAVEPSRLRGPITDVIPLADGLLVICGGDGSKEIAAFDPRRQPLRFEWRMLPDPLDCPPIALGDRLLVPSKAGVFLLDPRTAQTLAEPFGPRREPGVGLDWQLPAALDENQAVLADGHSKVYRLAVGEVPKPHLAAIGQVETTQPIASPVAVIGDVAYAVDAARTLNVFKLPKLTRLEAQPQSLSGRCVWGPRRVDDCVMLATDDDRLLCLGADGKLRWQVELPYGPLAGTPLSADGEYILAAVGGVVWRVDAKNGQELGKLDTARPLATGPVPVDSGLLLGGHDGSLYRVEVPRGP